MNEHRGLAAVLLAYPFRPFFLLTALYGVFIMVAWMGFFYGGWPLPLGVSPFRWHAHEMLFGLIPAAIAGFLLTAVTNWTGAPPLKGRGLLALVLLWVAGRGVMWTAGWLPGSLVAVVDLAFLIVLAAYAAGVLHRYGNRRNLVLVAVLAVLALANGLMHLEFLGLIQTAVAGERLAMNVIALLMVVIAGRITPLFTAGWLRTGGGDPAHVHRSERVDQLALVSTALMVPADLVTGIPLLGAVVALLAAGINGFRLVQWAGWRTGAEPLLWILHVGYAWIVAALLLKGLAPFIDGLTPSVWLHGMGVGAVGTLLLAVMTRVSLGHTGRALRLPRFAVAIYVSILLAGGLRMLTAFGGIDFRLGLLLSALAWSIAFALFLILYWPILASPRVDGRPG